MSSSDKKYIKKLLAYLKKLADPPESFSHRQKTHHMVSLKLNGVNGKTQNFSLPKTPSDHRTRKNIAADIRRMLTDEGIPYDRNLLNFLIRDSRVDGLTAEVDPLVTGPESPVKAPAINDKLREKTKLFCFKLKKTGKNRCGAINW